MMNKTIYNTLSSRGNEGSSGIEMFRQAQHDKQPCHPERSEGSQQTIKTKKMMNKAIHNTLSSRGNEGSSGIEMFRQAQHDKQQLHKKTPLLVMLNLVQHLIIQPITSLRVAERIEKPILHFQIFLCSIFFLLSSFFSTAQN